MQSTAAREPLTVAHDDSAQDDLLAAVDLPSLEASPRRAPSLETGVVRGTASGLLVELGGGLVVARRAKSCLVAPDAGDRVLCVADGDQVFVLAVLEGEAGATTRIVAEGDLKVQATGRLGLGAGDQIEIAAAREVGLFTGKLQIRAQAAAAAIEELGLVGRSLEAHLQQAVVVAERMEVRADRLVQRAKKAFRFIEALDQVRAGIFDLRAEGLAAVRGENTIVAARTLAKLDGEQVKIG
ncbi:DUF3540 domain-containing protein [Sorangium sp. So ce362]|uniref:DUF3540 domain-containing protein n=1 Tax=Sorangium sp. So ce362 TaxID=3133303 RepID=UPI003F5D5CC4